MTTSIPVRIAGCCDIITNARRKIKSMFACSFIYILQLDLYNKVDKFIKGAIIVFRIEREGARNEKDPLQPYAQ